ncbi:hypothetical protein FTUN_1930 [Frigoriglobus tundricola]|uniref:Uncharacterized protein n=1 Tax=Frigoriglobus tundricola TaxID=2774151 RepID=A0A6M5YM30_9BACT|nr:hypothetical protein FTUN_1930 [Frigoriglobus tundricola]
MRRRPAAVVIWAEGPVLGERTWSGAWRAGGASHGVRTAPRSGRWKRNRHSNGARSGPFRAAFDRIWASPLKRYPRERFRRTNIPRRLIPRRV